jgi:hypothetical protein
MEAKAKPYVQSQQRQVSGSHTTNRNKGIKAVRVSHARDSSNKARGTGVQGIDGGMQTCCLSASVVEKRKEMAEGANALSD